MVKKITKDIVNERLSSRNIELIGDYTNRRMKSLFKCSESHVWEAVVGSVIYGGGCPYCSNKVPLTKDIVNTRVSARNIKLIGDYINNSSKTLFRCDEGHEWNASPHHIMEGSGCPSCAKHGFKSDKPGTIYVLHYKSLNCIKYGISNNFDQRFTRLSYQGDCDLLHKIDFPIGKTAQDIERRIKKELGGEFSI